MDSLSNAIIVSKSLVKENPKVVRPGLVRAIKQGNCLDSLHKDIDMSWWRPVRNRGACQSKIRSSKRRFVQTP